MKIKYITYNFYTFNFINFVFRVQNIKTISTKNHNFVQKVDKLTIRINLNKIIIRLY